MELLKFVLISIIIILAYYWLKKKATKNHDFFAKLNLKFRKPLPVLGNSDFMFTGTGFLEKIIGDYYLYPDEKVIGIFDFLTPQFFIRSPELVKQLTVKDFSYFQDHRNFVDPDSNDLFKSVLFTMKGKQWRDMRSTLSPLFTGSKMRNMLELINSCAKQVVEYIQEDYVKNGPTAYSTKDIFSKYTNDVIATCVFGVECDSLRNPKNEIYLIGQKMMQFQKPWKLIQFFFMRAFPKLAKLLGMGFLDAETNQRFYDLIIHTMEVRKREGIVRPDMIQLLMSLREEQHSNSQDQKNNKIETEKEILNSEMKHSWTDNELIAQSFLFFLAGFDTSSTVMNFTAYELAVNPDVQNRLILEIDETNENLRGEKLTYETLKKMKYLDMVISEALRKWPPAVAVDRECVKNYSYEDDEGLKFTVEKGNGLMIPVFSFHSDPKYFPDPEKFDPERFNDENKPNINMDAYLPFGIGPRNCIGMRFALMEVKALFYYLLLNFKLKPSETTQVPIKLKKSVFALVPDKEIRLYLEPRSPKMVN